MFLTLLNQNGILSFPFLCLKFLQKDPYLKIWMTFPQTWGMRLLLLTGLEIWTFSFRLVCIDGGAVKNFYYLCFFWKWNLLAFSFWYLTHGGIIYSPIMLTLKSNPSLQLAKKKQTNKQSETNKNFMIHQIFLFFVVVRVLILWLSACHIFSWEIDPAHSSFILMSALWDINESFQKWCLQSLTQCNAGDNISLKDSGFHASHLSNAFLLMCS